MIVPTEPETWHSTVNRDKTMSRLEKLFLFTETHNKRFYFHSQQIYTDIPTFLVPLGDIKYDRRIVIKTESYESEEEYDSIGRIRDLIILWDGYEREL